jgi:cell division protein FtsI (penicillin-binding protein 3)
MSRKKQRQDVFVKRQRIVIAFCAAFILLCLAGMVYLACFQQKKYSGSVDMYPVYSSEQFDTIPPEMRENCVVEYYVNPPRGIIFDDKDMPLVSNVRVYPIGVDGMSFNKNHRYFKENEPYLDTLIYDLAVSFYNQFSDRYPSYSVEDYRAKFTRALKDQKFVTIFSEDQVVREHQMVLAKDLAFIKHLPLFSRTIDTAAAVRARYGFSPEQMAAKKLKKLYFADILNEGNSELLVRVHPYGDLAQRILGSMTKGNGIDGNPKFDKVLTGVPGVKKRLYINGVSIPLESEMPPVNGGAVYTTINTEIQRIVHKELYEKCMETKPKWACAVVMETATGDIKAMSNLTRYANGDTIVYLETRNHAMVSESAEPGSTFKLASLLAYLEQSHCDTTKKYVRGEYTFQVGKRRYSYKDSHSHGPVYNTSIKEIFKHSSNVGVAQMMRDTSVFHSYAEYSRKLDSMFIPTGLSAQIITLKPVNMHPDTRSFTEQYGYYFGAGFCMQPLQTLVYYNAVANGGKMMQPRFVRSTVLGKEREEEETVVMKEQIASPQTIKIAQEFLRAVVMEKGGTAYGCHDDNFPIAGKTGTRDIYDQELGRYDYSRNAISFCGYFPADNPKYTCIVYLFDVKKQYGSGEAARLFSNIAHQIIFPAKEIDQSTRHLTAKRPVRWQTLNAAVQHWKAGAMPSEKADYCIATREDETQFTGYTVVVKDSVPNVVGLCAADAIAEVRKSGHRVQISGKGNVTSQSFNRENNTITLTLNP